MRQSLVSVARMRRLFFVSPAYVAAVPDAAFCGAAAATVLTLSAVMDFMSDLS